MSSDADNDNPEENVFKFGEESLSDVIFVVDGNEFHCHRMLLAAKSSFFAAMFTSEFKEKNEERIEIKETDAVAFKRLMQILYDSRIEDEFLLKCNTGFTIPKSQKLWTDTCALLELADRFLIMDMIRHVVETHFLINSLRCPYKKTCSHCPIKLLLALRFKMVEYKEMNVPTKDAANTAVERLKKIDAGLICDAEGIDYLMKLE